MGPITTSFYFVAKFDNLLSFDIFDLNPNESGRRPRLVGVSFVGHFRGLSMDYSFFDTLKFIDDDVDKRVTLKSRARDTK